MKNIFYPIINLIIITISLSSCGGDKAETKTEAEKKVTAGKSKRNYFTGVYRDL